MATGSSRIYPTYIGYILRNQNQHSWIQNLRAETQRFDDPMCFEAWKMSGRHQGMFSGYALVSRTICLNFTQETKKFFKLHEDELKLKI
jgi:hypothetical protein